MPISVQIEIFEHSFEPLLVREKLSTEYASLELQEGNGVVLMDVERIENCLELLFCNFEILGIEEELNFFFLNSSGMININGHKYCF